MGDISRQQFWTAVSILLNNYHAINRKLCACIVHKVETVSEAIRIESDKATLMEHLQQIALGVDKDLEGFIVHFKCLTKKGEQNIAAIGTLDFSQNFYRLSFACNKFDDFEVKWKEGTIHINLLNPQTDVETRCRWDEYVLKPKLLKWCHVADSDVDLKAVLSHENASLRLVNVENYNRLYNELKVKYSEVALKLWDEAKESTDPLKFIYEDLAIAAYLITLWQSDTVHHSPQAFADLGCGNGLLVYILIEEGYHGYGYDIRSRKLWSLYPLNVSHHLQEQAVEPLKFSLPAEVDWIIGNHSDELSPWIPVLAATCRYQMNYFLLPCCAFEFSGNKFQRRNSSVSAYKDFCDYAENISNRCGFITEKDRLKIPSTKRIAFIGRNRKYSRSVHDKMVEDIRAFIASEQHVHSVFDHMDVKIRNKVETVRNCTQIDKNIIHDLVMKIFLLLLNDSGAADSSSWLSGRSLTMPEIAKKLDCKDLKQIKAECGGLKTLLRNKHEIFELYKPDFVRIRKPHTQTSQNSNKPQTIKKRACFFHEHHPQGCPLASDQCTFLH